MNSFFFWHATNLQATLATVADCRSQSRITIKKPVKNSLVLVARTATTKTLIKCACACVQSSRPFRSETSKRNYLPAAAHIELVGIIEVDLLVAIEDCRLELLFLGQLRAATPYVLLETLRLRDADVEPRAVAVLVEAVTVPPLPKCNRNLVRQEVHEGVLGPTVLTL